MRKCSEFDNYKYTGMYHTNGGSRRKWVPASFVHGCTVCYRKVYATGSFYVNVVTYVHGPETGYRADTSSLYMGLSMRHLGSTRHTTLFYILESFSFTSLQPRLGSTRSGCVTLTTVAWQTMPKIPKFLASIKSTSICLIIT